MKVDICWTVLEGYCFCSRLKGDSFAVRVQKHLKPPIKVRSGLNFHISMLVLALELSVREICSGYVLIKVNLLKIMARN